MFALVRAHVCKCVHLCFCMCRVFQVSSVFISASILALALVLVLSSWQCSPLSCVHAHYSQTHPRMPPVDTLDALSSSSSPGNMIDGLPLSARSMAASDNAIHLIPFASLTLLSHLLICMRRRVPRTCHHCARRRL